MAGTAKLPRESTKADRTTRRAPAPAPVRKPAQLPRESTKADRSRPRAQLAKKPTTTAKKPTTTAKKPTTSTAKPAATTVPKTTTPSTAAPRPGTEAYLDQAEMAQNYGFALSFLTSYPEIYKIFQEAVQKGWEPNKFIAAIRNTSFYQTHAESWRQTEVLKKSDPQSYNNRIAQITAELSNKATSLGAPMSWTQLQAMADNALRFNWNDAQINDQMGSYVKAVNGVYNGAVGDDVQSLRQTAWRNGVQLSDSTIQSYASQIAKGGASRGFFEKMIRQQAKTAAPGYADQLDAGMDLYEVANPYIESMARILEINPKDIDLFDNGIRGALSATGGDGKPTSKSLWQFENELRKDPRWLSTNNARDATMSVAHKVLQDMGFSS